MNRIVPAILSAVLAFSLTACGSNLKTTGTGYAAEVGKLLEGELTGEITVSCYEAMLYEKFLNESSALFEHKHPGTKINVKVFSKMPEMKMQEMEDGSVVGVTEGGDDSAAVLDYISSISTELMSEKGADILAFDVLPYYKYAESEILEDLRYYMEADSDFEINDYKSNIIEAVKYKGGQYIMPLDFSYSFYSFDKSRIDSDTAEKLMEKDKFTYWELTDLIKEQFADDKSGARVIDFQGGAQQAFRTLFNHDYKKYVDLENKKADFLNGDFVNLLEDIKEQRNKGFFRPDFSDTDEQMRDFIEGQRLYYLKQQIDMMLKYIFDPDETGSDSFPLPETDEIAGLIVNSEGQAAFRSMQSYGISSNSGNKKLAWEFLKFMLGEEMQGSLNLLGNPVNNNAFIEASKLNMIKTPNDVSMNDGDFEIGGYRENADEKYANTYENYMKCLNGFVEALNLYPVTDKIINEMVQSETALYFDGSRTAEEVSVTLQNKVQLYLSE